MCSARMDPLLKLRSIVTHSRKHWRMPDCCGFVVVRSHLVRCLRRWSLYKWNKTWPFQTWTNIWISLTFHCCVRKSTHLLNHWSIFRPCLQLWFVALNRKILWRIFIGSIIRWIIPKFCENWVDGFRTVNFTFTLSARTGKFYWEQLSASGGFDSGD